MSIFLYLDLYISAKFNAHFIASNFLTLTICWHNFELPVDFCMHVIVKVNETMISSKMLLLDSSDVVETIRLCLSAELRVAFA